MRFLKCNEENRNFGTLNLLKGKIYKYFWDQGDVIILRDEHDDPIMIKKEDLEFLLPKGWVRCIEDKNIYAITKGKVYPYFEETTGGHIICDDEGFLANVIGHLEEADGPEYVFWFDVNDEDTPPQIQFFKVDGWDYCEHQDGSKSVFVDNKLYDTCMSYDHCFDTIEEACWHWKHIETNVRETYERRKG